MRSRAVGVCVCAVQWYPVFSVIDARMRSEASEGFVYVVFGVCQGKEVKQDPRKIFHGTHKVQSVVLKCLLKFERSQGSRV